MLFLGRRSLMTATGSTSSECGRWRSTPAGGTTSRGGAERRVLEHAGLVLDQLDAAVEGAVLDHLEGDVRIAVVDAFLARSGDHRNITTIGAILIVVGLALNLVPINGNRRLYY